MLKLVQTDWGKFDLAFDDGGDNDVDADVATLIYAALFTDAEAPAERVSDPYDRRGWYADPAAGSGLWYVRRQPLHSAARREAVAMVRQALTERAPALTDVACAEEVFPGSSDSVAGNVSRVFLVVSGFHNGRKFIVKAPL